jgi:hypothetical protein
VPPRFALDEEASAAVRKHAQEGENDAAEEIRASLPSHAAENAILFVNGTSRIYGDSEALLHGSRHGLGMLDGSAGREQICR